MVDCRSLWEWDILKEASDFNYYIRKAHKKNQTWITKGKMGHWLPLPTKMGLRANDMRQGKFNGYNFAHFKSLRGKLRNVFLEIYLFFQKKVL